jgi:hypothetical protein
VPLSGGTATNHAVTCSNSRGSTGFRKLISDGTNLFCTSPNGIRSISFAGTVIGTLSDVASPFTLLDDGTHVFYVDSRGVSRVAKSLDVATRTVVVADADVGDPTVFAALAQDATHLYLSTTKTFVSSVWRKPKAGGAAEPIVAGGPWPNPEGTVRSLVVVDSMLYFTFAPTGTQVVGGSRLLRVDKTATNATPEDLGGANQFDVLTDATYLYYGNGSDIVRRRR